MNEPKYPIQVVSDNKAKGLSFKENFKRYNKAKASGFYLECLWILYSMLEDRTSAFFYYLGFASSKNRNTVTGSKKIKVQVRQILNMTDSTAKYKFDTISGKLSRISQIIAWSVAVDDDLTDYQKVIKNIVEVISTNQDFLDALEYLNDEWRDKRNQLMHSLFNKNPGNVSLELKSLVEKGYTAARIIDKAVSQVKKEKIREQFKIR